MYSAYLDGDLGAPQTRQVTLHLEDCASCREHFRSLRGALALLADVPREPAGGVSSRVLDRIELESRGPGLALLFRPAWAARPLILPSLIPAALVLVTVLAGALALDRDPRPFLQAARSEPAERRLPPSGTEANPLFPSASVSAPVIRDRGQFPDAAKVEGNLFIETIVARDGSVATVTVLEGDSEQARPYVDALRHERFEPARLRGRPVAVSVYRLISRMEVRAAPAI
jgi:hypothetical protein